MLEINQNLIDSLNDKPEYLRSKHLIELGLFGSFSDICLANKRGCGPPHIRIGDRKMVYPKRQLIEWLHQLQNKSLVGSGC